MANEARRRIDLTEHLRGSLQAPIGEHIVGSNLHDDGTLIVMASGPEWASRLRFESAALLAACRERHPAAMNVRIRVAHEEHAGGA